MWTCPSHPPHNKRMSWLVNTSISAATPRHLFRKPLAQREASLVSFGHTEVETTLFGGWVVRRDELIIQSAITFIQRFTVKSFLVANSFPVIDFAYRL